MRAKAHESTVSTAETRYGCQGTTENVRLAGVVSMFPAGSTARTLKTWEPNESAT